jgi:hypothetical protein
MPRPTARFDVNDESDDTVLASAVSAQTAAELLGGVTAADVTAHVERYGRISVNELSCTPAEE